MIEIVKAPNEVLTKKAEKIAKGDTDSVKILAAMKKFIEESQEAVGLAMPQVGISRRGFIMLTKDNKIITVINPVILKHSNKKKIGEEGCLSIDGVIGMVSRWESIDVLYTNEKFKNIKTKMTGIDARIFQHELDHLNGILITDKIVQDNTAIIL